MFWIPICFVAFVIFLIFYSIDSFQIGKAQSDYNTIEQKRKALCDILLDENLENRLRYERKWRMEENKQIVRDFMGGEERWADYTDGADFNLKVLMVLMAKQGKLPADCVQFSFRLQLSEKTLHTPGPHQILPDAGRKMNEEFVLKIEDYLRNVQRIPATAYCAVKAPDLGYEVSMPLREIQRKYGAGLTHYFTSFYYLKE